MFRRISLPDDSIGTLRSDAVPSPWSRALDADLRHCRDLTRREAANFYWGFIALPHGQRMAIYALYSFARQVDDEADIHSGGIPDVSRLLQHRERLGHCYEGCGNDPVIRVLSDVVVRYGIPRAELEALIDGVETDLLVHRYATWGDLQAYCRLVASTIGRMCVRIFGFQDAAALEYADELGLALQLTNILRDVREDASLGRVYLPQEDLDAFGVHCEALADGGIVDGWEDLARFEIERAHDLFERGLRVTHCIPRRAGACVLTMAGIYQAVLLEIARNPYLPLSRRVSLGGHEKLAIMLRSWLHAA
jgi:15-cis-phytoene synthase